MHAIAATCVVILAGLFMSLAQRQRSPSRHLWRVMVERLVGFHFHWLFLASLSEIVAGTVDALSIDGVEGPLNVR